MGNFCPDFQYYEIEGKKSRIFFFLVQNFTKMWKINMKGEYYITIFLFLFLKIAKFQPKNEFFFSKFRLRF